MPGTGPQLVGLSQTGPSWIPTYEGHGFGVLHRQMKLSLLGMKRTLARPRAGKLTLEGGDRDTHTRRERERARMTPKFRHAMDARVAEATPNYRKPTSPGEWLKQCLLDFNLLRRLFF